MPDQYVAHSTQIVAIGEFARHVLERSGRLVFPLAEFPDAPYYEADGEILWVGARLPAMHPRAVATTAAVSPGKSVYFEALPSSCWTPDTPASGTISLECAARCAKTLRNALMGLRARGFGELLAGRIPPFPLQLAASRVYRLARAYANDDADAVFAASDSLLGVGSGLTPSGDDLAGAALFGRRYLAPCDPRWKIVEDHLAERITRATHHRISAALFRDLIAGHSFAPLHDLAKALLTGREKDAQNAARILVEIGHSSGWDMLTGLIIGMLGEEFAVAYS